MTKTEIRKQMKGLNTALSSEQREELSARIFNEAERLPAFARAKVVALFASLKDEPLTAPALERWSRSKRIVLPRVEGDIMRFYDYDPASMNDSGSFGISEPEATALCRPEEIDFIIVPGVAFTAAGMRLGRGKGFYDKYLSQPGFRAFKAGVCYPHQVVEELPADPFDVPVDHLCCGRENECRLWSHNQILPFPRVLRREDVPLRDSAIENRQTPVTAKNRKKRKHRIKEACIYRCRLLN